jgi:general nucleoside transport system permease protein
LSAIVRPFAALAIAAALICLVLLALGASPIVVFAALGQGAFGDWFTFTETLVKAMPLLFTGLAVAIAFQSAIWNIGADGQLLMGALIAGAIGPMLGGMTHLAAVSLMLAAGVIGGALWGGLAGWLLARFAVNEVISTIMLNFIAAQLLSWAVHGPLIEASHNYPQSRPIVAAAYLHTWFPPSRLNGGIPLALVLAAALAIFLTQTDLGFQLRAMGHNRRAAAFFGIPLAALTTFSMALSGALAGLGGAVQVAAITHRLYETMSPGWGYEAIAVALIARLNPLAVIPSAILFGALDNGSQAVQRVAGVSAELVMVLQALVIMVLLVLDASATHGFGGTFRKLAHRAPAPIAEP